MPVFLIFLTAFIALITICEHRSWAKFREKFPPISDEEFMANCRPGTNPEIALKVRRMISESLAVDYERVYPSSRFVEDLGAN